MSSVSRAGELWEPDGRFIGERAAAKAPTNPAVGDQVEVRFAGMRASVTIEARPAWQSNHTCACCKISLRKFLFWGNRVFCRLCGRAVCRDCSTNRRRIPQLGYQPGSTTRVCDECLPGLDTWAVRTFANANMHDERQLSLLAKSMPRAASSVWSEVMSAVPTKLKLALLSRIVCANSRGPRQVCAMSENCLYNSVSLPER